MRFDAPRTKTGQEGATQAGWRGDGRPIRDRKLGAREKEPPNLIFLK